MVAVKQKSATKRTTQGEKMSLFNRFKQCKYDLKTLNSHLKNTSYSDADYANVVKLAEDRFGALEVINHVNDKTFLSYPELVKK